LLSGMVRVTTARALIRSRHISTCSAVSKRTTEGAGGLDTSDGWSEWQGAHRSCRMRLTVANGTAGPPAAAAALPADGLATIATTAPTQTTTVPASAGSHPRKVNRMFI